MLLNAEGLVFAGHRINLDAAETWQMPQGGIDEGEDLRAAAFRELGEEVGTTKAKILAESRDWFTYDLPDDLIGVALQGRYRGQRMKFFCMRFLGADSDINIATPHPEFDAWQWLDLQEFEKRVVAFKREVYRKVIGEFRPLARPA